MRVKNSTKLWLINEITLINQYWNKKFWRNNKFYQQKI